MNVSTALETFACKRNCLRYTNISFHNLLDTYAVKNTEKQTPLTCEDPNSLKIREFPVGQNHGNFMSQISPFLQKVSSNLKLLLECSLKLKIVDHDIDVV